MGSASRRQEAEGKVVGEQFSTFHAKRGENSYHICPLNASNNNRFVDEHGAEHSSEIELLRAVWGAV